MAKTTRKAKAGKSTAAAAAGASQQRKVVVFMTLLAVMTGTGALLLVLAPAPLTAGASSSLFAVGAPDSLDTIFQTSTPIQPGRWTSIYIHHSATNGGNATTLGESSEGLPDHFVIGNGDGCGDGEVQVAQRWHRQTSAGRVGQQPVQSDRISICVIGDFERSLPTNTQMLRLTQLVAALQDRCGIPAANVFIYPPRSAATSSAPSAHQTASAVGVGRYFPIAKLRDGLLP